MKRGEGKMTIRLSMPDVISEEQIKEVNVENDRIKARNNKLLIAVSLLMAFAVFVFPLLMFLNMTQQEPLPIPLYTMFILMFISFCASVLYKNRTNKQKHLVTYVGDDSATCYNPHFLWEISEPKYEILIEKSKCCQSLLKESGIDVEECESFTNAMKLIDNIKQENRMPFQFEYISLMYCFDEYINERGNNED